MLGAGTPSVAPALWGVCKPEGREGLELPLLLPMEEWREQGEASQKCCPGTLNLWEVRVPHGLPCRRIFLPAKTWQFRGVCLQAARQGRRQKCPHPAPPLRSPPQDAGASSSGGSGWRSKPVCREAGLRIEKNKNNGKCYQLSDENCSQSTPGVRSLLQTVGGMGDRKKRGHRRKSR